MPARTSLTHPLEIGEVKTDSVGLIGIHVLPREEAAGGDVRSVGPRPRHRPRTPSARWGRDRRGDPHYGSRIRRNWESKRWGMRSRPAAWHGTICQSGTSQFRQRPSRRPTTGCLRTSFVAWWPTRRSSFHCKGGLGRAGMVAARLLVESGYTPEDAIERVRAARPGAIETQAQERYVLAQGSRDVGAPAGTR